MTDSLQWGLSTSREPALEHALDRSPQPPEQPIALSALNIVRRTASASRTFGRFAVGLRPILDPDALPSAAQEQAEDGKNKDQEQEPGG